MKSAACLKAVLLVGLCLAACSSKVEEKLEACYGDTGFVLEMTCEDLKIELAARSQGPGEPGKSSVASARDPNDPALVNGTRIQLYNIKQALDAYKIQFGEYPTTEIGIHELYVKNILADRPKDMWGHEFYYLRHSPSKFTLKSLGADGAPGGEGADEDIPLGEQE